VVKISDYIAWIAKYKYSNSLKSFLGPTKTKAAALHKLTFL